MSTTAPADSIPPFRPVDEATFCGDGCYDQPIVLADGTGAHANYRFCGDEDAADSDLWNADHLVNIVAAITDDDGNTVDFETVWEC